MKWRAKAPQPTIPSRRDMGPSNAQPLAARKAAGLYLPLPAVHGSTGNEDSRSMPLTCDDLQTFADEGYLVVRGALAHRPARAPQQRSGIRVYMQNPKWQLGMRIKCQWR